MVVRVVRNDARGELVEEIVASALEPEWQHCSTDSAPCDLIHSTRKLGLQVKRSAARQTWHKDNARPPKPCFSIKEKKGRWDGGDKWIEERGRNAEIFVFAWHPGTSRDADHRNPHQWEFFVIPERELPTQSSISLSRIRPLTEPVSFDRLAIRVRSLAGHM